MVTLSSHLSTPVTGWLLRTLGYFFPEPIFGTTWDRKCVLTFKGRGEEEKLRSEQPSGKLIWPSHPTLIIGNKSVKKHWPWPIAQTCSLQYKVIHRSHITQSKMFKLGLSNTGFCSKCTLGSTDAICTPYGSVNQFTLSGSQSLRLYPPSWATESLHLLHYVSLVTFPKSTSRKNTGIRCLSP